MMDKNHIKEYEEEYLALFNGNQSSPPNYYVACIAVNNINECGLELSWYPAFPRRFHEVHVRLPKDELIVCVECHEYDDKPRLFVKSNWLEWLYLKSYSAFAIIDAIDIKKTIESGALSAKKLNELRRAIDKLAAQHTDISFISFADSLLLKASWTAGYFQKGQSYTYHPENLLYIFQSLKSIYKDYLGLDIYGVFSQGTNEYEDSGLHISPSKNHICLNSLGTPFADLQAIERKARKSIKNNIHKCYEIYMDGSFYHSLQFQNGPHKEKQCKQVYDSKMKTSSSYYCSSLSAILNNLRKK